MRQKQIKLFDKTIHEVKGVIAEITNERKRYHLAVSKIRREHDTEVKKQIKELLVVIDDLYELFTELTDEKEK